MQTIKKLNSHIRYCKHPDLVEFYHSYEGEKTKYENFFGRVTRYGYSMDEAILPGRKGRKDLTKGKIDDNGRECTNCKEYKTREKFHRSKSGIHRRTGDCIACRNKRKREYRERTNYKKDREYKKRTRKLEIGEKIVLLKPVAGIYEVVSKKKMQAYIIENIHTNEYLRLDPIEGNPNYKKFYRFNPAEPGSPSNLIK